MNNLQTFDFNNNVVRTVLINNEPYFVGKDVAMILGYSNQNEAIQDHVDEEDKLNSKTLLSCELELGQRGGWLINESGVYSLVFSSKIPSAKAFKRWVTSKVLPTLRKTGTYSVNQIDEAIKETNLLNARANVASIWLKIGDEHAIIPEYKQICYSKATEVLAGKPVLPLPESKEVYYSATEVGKMLGVSANKVGGVANKYNLKTENNGKWFFDKSRYSSKEVQTFKYNQHGIDTLRSYI